MKIMTTNRIRQCNIYLPEYLPNHILDVLRMSALTSVTITEEACAFVSSLK